MRVVPINEIKVVFVRSQGPGGQNVNKTSTKAQLRWHIWDSRAFTDEEKALIARALSSYTTWKGEIILSSDETRSQEQNKQRVIRKLNSLVEKAIIPAKLRVPTKPTRASKAKRLDLKKKHSEKKKKRRFIDLFFF